MSCLNSACSLRQRDPKQRTATPMRGLKQRVQAGQSQHDIFFQALERSQLWFSERHKEAKTALHLKVRRLSERNEVACAHTEASTSHRASFSACVHCEFLVDPAKAHREVHNFMAAQIEKNGHHVVCHFPI